MEIYFMKLRRIIPFLVKFGLVGFSGLVIDYALTYFIKDVLLLNSYLANIAGFTIAATSNFFLNRLWTFHNREKKLYKQFISFAGISIAGLLINTFLLYNFYELLGIPFYLSKALAIILVFIWNFSLNALFTFKKKQTVLDI